MEKEVLLKNTETMADYEAHFDDANPWNIVKRYLEEGTVLHLTIEGIVNGGAIAMVEGIRGFIPASRLSLSYIDDLESYLLKEVDVKVIEADQAGGRLVLSAREILKEEEKKAPTCACSCGCPTSETEESSSFSLTMVAAMKGAFPP